MDFKFLISNSLINVCIISWIAAQFFKTLINLIQNKKFDKGRLSGAGGMPSSHSAVVCSVVYASCYEYGWGSPIFAFSVVLATIVMYDATGVRWAAGLHAKAINNIVAYLEESEHPDKKELDSLIPKLNESLGHRFIEVICGAILGIAIAIIVQYLKYGTFTHLPN